MSSEIIKKLTSLERKMGKMNSRIDRIYEVLSANSTRKNHPNLRANTEQLTEHTEQVLTQPSMNRVRGKHRELLALFVNNGFHNYEQIAKKLNISQSRARAYVSELKKDYGIPLRQVKDAEGLKIGVDIAFIDQILAFK